MSLFKFLHTCKSYKKQNICSLFKGSIITYQVLFEKRKSILQIKCLPDCIVDFGVQVLFMRNMTNKSRRFKIDTLSRRRQSYLRSWFLRHVDQHNTKKNLLESMLKVKCAVTGLTWQLTVFCCGLNVKPTSGTDFAKLGYLLNSFWGI